MLGLRAKLANKTRIMNASEYTLLMNILVAKSKHLMLHSVNNVALTVGHLILECDFKV